MAGAPEGNTNRATQYRIKRTLEAVLEKRGSRADGLEALATACEAMLLKAEGGDVQAFKEIADRLDGKVAQPIGGDPNLPPIRQSMTVDFVSPIPRET